MKTLVVSPALAVPPSRSPACRDSNAVVTDGLRGRPLIVASRQWTAPPSRLPPERPRVLSFERRRNRVRPSESWSRHTDDRRGGVCMDHRRRLVLQREGPLLNQVRHRAKSKTHGRGRWAGRGLTLTGYDRLTFSEELPMNRFAFAVPGSVAAASVVAQ